MKKITSVQIGRKAAAFVAVAAFTIVSSLFATAHADGISYYEVGGDNSDFTLADLPSGVTAVKKIGTGTMTDTGALDGLSLVVEQGKVVILPNTGRTGFRHYRFKVERNTSSGNTGMQISELRLYNGETDVTGLCSGIRFDGREGTNDGVNAYPTGQTPDKAVDGEVTTFWFDRRLKQTGYSWTETDREKVWLQISFANEQRVTSYDWARGEGTESHLGGRDPSDWRFQGSADGVHWLDLDVRMNFTTSKAKGTFVGPFECSHDSEDFSDRFISVVARPGTYIEIRNTALEANYLCGGGAVTCVDGGEVRVRSGVTKQNDIQLSGSLRVLGGTWQVGGGVLDQYYRFTFKKVYAENNKFSLAEIALFDYEGERTGFGAYTVKTGIEPSALQPGEILCQTGDVFGGSGSEGPEKMFDGDIASGKCLYSKRNTTEDAYLDKGNPDKWFVFTVHLRDGFNPVYGYNFLSGDDYNSRNRSPVVWVVETSADGVTWTKRDEVDEYDKTPPNGNFIFWNGGDPWKLEDIPASALSLAAADVLVSTNAMLDICGTNAVIGRLSVDVALGGGTITTFVPAANGVLNIVNYPADTSIIGYELPLTIGRVESVENLRTWTLFVNGAARDDRITLIDGKLCIQPSPGIVIFIR